MNAYITATGAHLPGPPINNDEIENVLGLVDGKPSRLKKRILKANGIKTRHYALNGGHETTDSVPGMGAKAAHQALSASHVDTHDIRMLSCATTQGDFVAPGFASLMQAELGIPRVEIHTTHGICSSSLMAVKAAANTIRLGEQPNALVVASELASRLFKHTRYEAAGGGKVIDFNAEFLRWMLSDGAGALLVESTPSKRSARIDWIRSFSHADAYPLCMSIGGTRDNDDARTWQDFPTYAEAEAAGALLIRQDVKLLDDVVKMGIDGALRLIDEGAFNPATLDHMLCHYSSHHFRSKIFEMLDVAGASIAEHKWYTNLYERGNTGCASIFIMLDEFLRTHDLEPGETILCMVPESGRFNTAYMHLTMVENP
ncbi:MAG: 3-oxoacyl-[acyl-carrier-protein] synthase III C-terminal domain-containing protein [Pseudomonadota bacterium]